MYHGVQGVTGTKNIKLLRSTKKGFVLNWTSHSTHNAGREKGFWCHKLGKYWRFLLFPESDTMSSRSPVTYTRSPTTHDKDDPVVIKVPAFISCCYRRCCCFCYSWCCWFLAQRLIHYKDGPVGIKVQSQIISIMLSWTLNCFYQFVIAPQIEIRPNLCRQ